VLPATVIMSPLRLRTLHVRRAPLVQTSIAPSCSTTVVRRPSASRSKIVPRTPIVACGVVIL